MRVCVLGCAAVIPTSPTRTAAKRLVSQPKALIAIEALLLTVLVGFGDIATGAELSFSIFYLLPITLVAWSMGRRYALVNAVLAMFAWLIADFVTGYEYPSVWLPYWNASIRLGYFVLFALIFSRLRDALDQEKSLSRRDALTGAFNRRAFEELAAAEVARSSRYGNPMTLAVMDIDGFKQINDRFGHAVGDDLLREVATTLDATLRASDIVARLGGDEFAVVMPETDESSAHEGLTKTKLALSDRMTRRGWPVTFSFGSMSTGAASVPLGELLAAADRLMYQAKRSGGDKIEAASSRDVRPVGPPSDG